MNIMKSKIIEFKHLKTFKSSLRRKCHKILALSRQTTTGKYAWLFETMGGMLLGGILLGTLFAILGITFAILVWSVIFVGEIATLIPTLFDKQ